MSAYVLPLSTLLYVLLPAWMGTRGWPIRAGLSMIGIALLPWATLTLEGKPWGPGAGFWLGVTAIMLIVAMLPIAYGAIRFVQRRTRPPTKFSNV